MTENKPPICSYEGSDYQKSFWEEGGREYEDAVEAVALERMLPTSGKLLLELGAGAGRNTPRYKGYEKIVLLDYSMSQLEQAQAKLGNSDRYIYVAADVYRLPFVEGLFDGATMIRTLHHMADAPKAINEVERVLAEDATFILEFANKQNLKAILRWTFFLTSKNPFLPTPLEFTKLNFNFHPKNIRKWLEDAGFRINKILTVSHLRSGFIKRILSLKTMVWLDSMFQKTGDYWQLSPSVFVKSDLYMEKTSSPGFFHCPACGSDHVNETKEKVVCQKCKHEYPIRNGIYDFRLD